MQKAAVLGTIVLTAALAVDTAAAQQSNVVRAPRTPVRLHAVAARAHLNGLVVTREEPPKPLRSVMVRARDGAGRVIGTERTDAAGRFAFAFDKPGSYFVEAVDE